MFTRGLFLATCLVMTGAISNMATAAPFKVDEASIADVHRAMANGQISTRQLVEIYLKRIEAYDKKGPSINAIIQLNPKALAEKERADRTAPWHSYFGQRCHFNH